jgi:hypothetical protein
MVSMESSTIQAKEADRAMIRDAMATYTGPINVVTPPPGTNALAEWRGVNQIALPGSSLNTRDQNELLAKVGRMRELAAQGAGAVSIAKSLKLSKQGLLNLAKTHGVALNG